MLEKIKSLSEKTKYGELNWPIQAKEKYRHFRNSEEAAEWGKKHYQSWADNYKLVMKEAKAYTSFSLFNSPIECCCGHSFRELNNYLNLKPIIVL